MLLKLLKYDMKSTSLKMFMVFAVYAVVCILVPHVIAFFKLNAALIYIVLTAPIGAIALCVLVFVFAFQRYAGNLYGSEGYLMFTLPVKGRMIIVSKIIMAFVWFTVASILSIASFATFFAVASHFSDSVAVAARSIGQFLLRFQVMSLVITMCILSTLKFIVQVYFSITVSKLTLWRKLGVLVGILTFIAINYVETIPSFFIKRTSDWFDFDKNVTAEQVTEVFSKIFSWQNMNLTLPLTIDMVFIIAMFVGTVLLVEKKTSLK